MANLKSFINTSSDRIKSAMGVPVDRIKTIQGSKLNPFDVIKDKLLFYGLYSEISDGKMPNKLGVDWLTVSGSIGSETFECPNTSPYISADTDYFWFNTDASQNTVTTLNLVSYDIQRTPVKYDDLSPYQIRSIGIIKAGETLTATEINNLFKLFELPILWNNSLNAYGHVKGNRVSQNLWTPKSFTFDTTWNTELAGSATKTIVIPTTGSGYNCNVDWGDGAVENFTGTPGNITHVYASAGIKKVKISGLFPRIYFNGSGDRLKLLSIDNWGNIVWGANLSNSFNNCKNMEVKCTDFPNLTNTTNLQGFYYGCEKNNGSLVGWDTSNVTNMVGMFFYNLVFNQDISILNTSKVALFEQMLYGCISFKKSLAGLNITSATNMIHMVQYANINDTGTTTNYDNTLISFASQTVKPNVTFDGGTSKYSSAAIAARAILTGAPNNWVITDGGLL